MIQLQLWCQCAAAAAAAATAASATPPKGTGRLEKTKNSELPKQTKKPELFYFFIPRPLVAN